MISLSRLLPLKLLETLHDGAIGQAFFVLDRGYSALLPADVVPLRARLIFVLGRVERQLISSTVVISVRGLTRGVGSIGLARLNYGCARRDQV